MSDIQYQNVTISVTNANPGQKIKVLLAPLAPQSSQVAWSTGAPMAASAGMQLTASGQPLPLQQLNITGTALTFLTSSAGGSSGALQFNFQLSLGGAGNPQFFTMSAPNDPNVLVTAALVGQLPQVINEAPTTLQWPS